MLRVENLEGFYGVSQALFGMAFEINAGEVVTLMGRNGMGKTTTVHAITGVLPGCRGTVEFDGKRVDRLPSFRIARLDGQLHAEQGLARSVEAFELSDLQHHATSSPR